MHFSRFSQLSILALVAPALSGVQFSANINQGYINAALTDNGGQICAVSERLPSGVGDVILSCIGGYSASFFANGIVTYSYGSFSGSFQTVHSTQQDGPFDPVVDYWTANVWGCYISDAGHVIALGGFYGSSIHVVTHGTSSAIQSRVSGFLLIFVLKLIRLPRFPIDTS